MFFFFVIHVDSMDVLYIRACFRQLELMLFYSNQCNCTFVVIQVQDAYEESRLTIYIRDLLKYLFHVSEWHIFFDFCHISFILLFTLKYLYWLRISVIYWLRISVIYWLRISVTYWLRISVIYWLRISVN